MNGEQWIQFDARLRAIETNSAATNQKLEDDDEWKEKISEFVDEIRIEMAKKAGAEEEAKKNAKAAGRSAGLLGGGAISVVIAGLKAVFIDS